MGRPRLFDKPLTMADRARRYRRKKRLDNLPAGYWATASPVTPAFSPVTKPPWRFDPKALIG